MVMTAWRFDGAASLQADTLDLVASLLYNGTAGLFDLNLASSALHMISVCEAILTKLPDNIVERGLSEVRVFVDSDSDLGDVVRAALGLERE